MMRILQVNQHDPKGDGEGGPETAPATIAPEPPASLPAGVELAELGPDDAIGCFIRLFCSILWARKQLCMKVMVRLCRIQTKPIEARQQVWPSELAVR